MIVGSNERYKEAERALQSVQQFDVESLVREDELGKQLNFLEAVGPAKQLVDLFNRLSVTSLQDLPDDNLKKVQDQANNVRVLFDQVIAFSVEQAQNPSAQRAELIQKIRQAYPGAFTQLHPLIAYSLHRSADFSRLDAEARATLKSIEDKSTEVSGKLAQYERDAAKALEEIRNVAAEEGVTQQAIHFKNEAASHEGEAEKWRVRTVNFAWALGVYAAASLFIHKIPFLVPDSTYDTVQLFISKVLVFFVIAYMLFLSAKNFMNHKHNAIVNKHRQNALMTHKAMVESSGNSGVRDAVLVQAAGCIFSPQATGYTDSRGDGESTSQKSVVEILSKTAANVAKTPN